MTRLQPVYIASTHVGDLRIAQWGVVFIPKMSNKASNTLRVMSWETSELAELDIRRAFAGKGRNGT